MTPAEVEAAIATLNRRWYAATGQQPPTERGDMNQQLLEARRARGLPDYAPYEPSYTRPDPTPEVPMQHCPVCDEDWPVPEFSHAASSARKINTPCNACFAERYGPMGRRRCAECGGSVSTRKPEGTPAYHRACNPSRGRAA